MNKIGNIFLSFNVIVKTAHSCNKATHQIIAPLNANTVVSIAGQMQIMNTRAKVRS